jgi:hypothetical protein
MNRVALPYTTRTSGVDIFDTDNLFRQRDIDPQLKMLNQDDGTFLKALELWSQKEPAIQALYHWVEDDMLDIATKINLAAGYSATATSLVVDDARLFVVNSEIYVQRTLENMIVTGVTYSTNTIAVTRGFGGTGAAALVDDDILISGPAHLPELGDANEGTGRVPTTEKYNFISVFSESFKISHLQDVAAMVDVGGRVASVEWEVVNKMFEIKRKVNKALIFEHRGTLSTADGTIYISQGFVHYMEDNVLNLGQKRSNLTWPVLSEWLDTLFEPTASSREKLVNCGESLFGSISRMKRDMSTVPVQYYHPELGTDMIEIMTERGNMCKFVRDRHGFPSNEGLEGWGIVVDMGHAYKREYTDTPMAWRQNIQAGTAHFRQDEYWGSFSLELHHPGVHGLIRDAGAMMIDR